jgi:hypothetical protein
MLARGTYTEQYMLTGIFFWLMAWRVLAHYGLGANAKALMMLAVASCLVAAFLEAGFLWARRGFDVLTSLGYNLSLAILDVGYPPAWQVLAFGLLIALGAAGSRALRPKRRAWSPARRSAARLPRKARGHRGRNSAGESTQPAAYFDPFFAASSAAFSAARAPARMLAMA